MKRKSFTGLFLQYIAFFCVSTLALLFFVFFVFERMIGAGMILPANYAEVQIEKNRERLSRADAVSEQMLPYGSRFGVFTEEGEYLYGTIASGKEQEEAWGSYKSKSRFAGGEGYFKFIPRDNGELCIVRYHIASRFAEDFAGGRLPDPVLCAAMLYILLFIVQAVLISRHFSKNLSKKLLAVRETTENIQRQNLEFERFHSDITEIEEILDSLCQMKDALRAALEEQWESKRQMKEQIGALVHDIKTPLTVIKGNTELLTEEEDEEEKREYLAYIGQNVSEIEGYLAVLWELLASEEERYETVKVECHMLAGKMAAQAESLALSWHRRVEVLMRQVEGEVRCDMRNIQRAWNNLLSNALEYTPLGKCIQVEFKICEDGGKKYLCAAVIDRGPGFSREELWHAAERFYQGDKSRHDKTHRGLGLAIASEFAKAQGGMVRFENAAEKGFGGRAELMIRIAGF